MNFKRVISSIIGMPIVAVFLILGNVYVVDVVVTVLAIISMYEYMKCFKVTKKAKPVSWIGYLSCLLIPCIHIVPSGYMGFLIGIAIPLVIFILFLHIITSNLEVTIKDAGITLFGIIYIVMFFAFFAKTYGISNGKAYIWYPVLAAWGSDIFAYAIGRRFGKHKFSQISPNKSVEGCIAGVVGAIVLSIGYTAILDNCYNYTVNYVIIGIITCVLSVIGQIGDFSASSIKRYVGVKDFGNLIPGHGGILDRFDSLIFIAPFAYFLLMLI